MHRDAKLAKRVFCAKRVSCVIILSEQRADAADGGMRARTSANTMRRERGTSMPETVQEKTQCPGSEANAQAADNANGHDARARAADAHGRETQTRTADAHDRKPQTHATSENNCETASPSPAHLFTFMGTGAGCGVPAFFCTCPACEEARRDPRAQRGDCGVMVRGYNAESELVPGRTLLIDTPPDCRHQLNREGVRTVDELLFTHCHSDHVGGLLELEYMVQLVTKKPLPTYGSAAALAGVNEEFGYMTYCLEEHAMEPFDTHEFDGVRYTALPVTHAAGTYGYLIETPETRLFYASDTGKLPTETAERVRDVDILAMDATFWKRCWSPAAHHSVQECIEEAFALNAGKLYLTHLAMHYDEPVTLAELEEYLKQYDGRVEAASDGLTFRI